MDNTTALTPTTYPFTRRDITHPVDALILEELGVRLDDRIGRQKRKKSER